MFRRRRHPALARRVSVSLESGEAIVGLLLDTPGEFLLLKDARLLAQARPGVAPTSTHLDGDVVIDRAKISFVQVLAPSPIEEP